MKIYAVLDRPVLSNAIATSLMWLLKFKVKVKYNLKFSSSVVLATFQVFNSHKWLGASPLDRAAIEQFQQSGMFYCSTVLGPLLDTSNKYRCK